MSNIDEQQRPARICRKCNTRTVERARSWICYHCGNKQRTPESIAKNRINNKIAMKSSTKRRRIMHAVKKAQVIERYGGKCYCCGESNNAFLSMDHINDDGSAQRAANQSQRVIFEYLYHKPVDLKTFRIACFDCNYARKHSIDKRCPHERGNRMTIKDFIASIFRLTSVYDDNQYIDQEIKTNIEQFIEGIKAESSFE